METKTTTSAKTSKLAKATSKSSKTAKSTKATKATKATTSKSKLQKVAKTPEAVNPNIRKGLRLNASEKTIQKQFQVMEEKLQYLKPMMAKLHGKTVAIDNKAIPGGWAKIEFDANLNILKCTATNSEDKEPRYISIFEYEMLHKEGLKQYKEWKKKQSI